MGVKVTVIGAGSTYTPELVEGFAAHRDRLPVEELAMFDVDGERLDVVGDLSGRILRRLEWDAYTPDRLDQIRAALRANLIAMMDAGRPA